MNIIFLTLSDINSIYDKNIYTDLLLEFKRKGHNVYIVSPIERKNKKKSYIIDEDICQILKVKIGNIKKTNIIEKGLSTVFIEYNYKNSIRKHFSDIKFDLVIYSTPPITLANTVNYLKKRDNASSYLLLKDIFPQNAVDLKMLKENGIGKYLYKYFKKKEKELYDVSDYIGCMSQANIDFILDNNKGLCTEKLEVCPNSITPICIEYTLEEIEMVRAKYGIPTKKTIYIYGGNLGKPQGIDFLIECLNANKENNEVYFVIAGSGTEFNKIKTFFEDNQPPNAQLFKQLPKNDYEVLANSCDVGLIFLDHRFTIPNFPSRLLSYMQASMPILAATDPNTDIGQVIEQGEFGYWCESNNVEAFNEKLRQLSSKAVREKMGNNARNYLEENYTSEHSYNIIMSHFK